MTDYDITSNIVEHTYLVTGMDCASCAQKIAVGVDKLDGVHSCSLNFTTGKLHVQGNISPERVVKRVQDLGYDVADPAHAASDSNRQHSIIAPNSFWSYAWQRPETRLALLGILLVMPALIFHELLPGLGISHAIIDAMAIMAMLVAGYPIVRNAWRSVKINHTIDMNVLMTIAAVGAVLIGAYVEAALIMVLFSLGEMLEGFTSNRARQSIRSLMEVAPNEAAVLRPCIDCAGHLGQDGYTGGPCPFCGLEAQLVPVTDLIVGETIIVKPGERIPMDGRILVGSSAINQAPITGESRLVDKETGDNVFAGSINGAGSLEVEVTHLASDNTISRLIAMVEEAQEKRAPAQRFVDRFARYYTPAVVFLAALVAIIPPLLLDQALIVPEAPAEGWLYRALALLVVACPCALVISTPVSIVSAISNGAKHGVLFKGGAFIEALGSIKIIAFDKTGTLTSGRPALIGIRAATCTAPNGTCDQCDDLLALAGSVEQRSEHPLARAIVQEAELLSLKDRYGPAQNVTALAGQGVQGQVNGCTITIGSHRYFDNTFPHAAHCAEVSAVDAQGFTTMLVSRDEEYLGYLTLADEVRPSSRAVITELKHLGLKQLVILTGDNEETAQIVANQIGVTDVRANCLPQDKVAAVHELSRLDGGVAMVGDGINDTPALATATVGIAIGSTAQAMETADITLMGDDLNQLPFAIRLSQAAMRTIWINVAFSIGIKLLFLLLILFGYGSMWLAVFADMGASLLVTLNGMRLLRHPSPKKIMGGDPHEEIS